MGAILRFATTKTLAGSGGRLLSTITVVGFVFKVARKLSGNGPKTLFTHELKPGEALVVSDGNARK